MHNSVICGIVPTSLVNQKIQSWTKYFGKAFLIMFVLILSSYFSSYCASAGLNQILGITIPPPISMLPFWVKFSGYKHLHQRKQH